MDKYRSHDWRYRECLECIEAKEHFRGDRVSRNLYNYLSASLKPLGASKSVLDRRHREISKAYQLWKDVTSGSKRWLLEAYALTDMSDQMIADEMMMDPKIVTAYFDCFFDVRDNFSKAKYIKDMRSFFCTYEHSFFPHMGFKYIIVTKGRETFERTITNRSELVNMEMEFYRTESRKYRSIKIWSKSWESINPDVAPGKFDIEEMGSYIESDRQDVRIEIAEQAKLPPATTGGIKAVFQCVKIQMLNTIDKNLSPIEERLIKVT